MTASVSAAPQVDSAHRQNAIIALRKRACTITSLSTNRGLGAPCAPIRAGSMSLSALNTPQAAKHIIGTGGDEYCIRLATFAPMPRAPTSPASINLRDLRLLDPRLGAAERAAQQWRKYPPMAPDRRQ